MPDYILGCGQPSVSPAEIGPGKGLSPTPEASSTSYPTPCTLLSFGPHDTWGPFRAVQDQKTTIFSFMASSHGRFPRFGHQVQRYPFDY